MNETRRHLELMYGDLEGVVALARGVGGRMENGSYKFKDWREEFFRWPADADKIVAWAESHAESDDLYVCPMLRELPTNGDRPSRKRGSGALARVVWSDVDGARGVPPKLASFWIQSGGPGCGYHVYLVLDGDPLPEDELEALNRRYAAATDADDCWSSTHVLRLAGTFNHKARASGGTSSPVRFRDAELRTFTMDELDAALPALDAEPEAELPAGRPALPASVPASVQAIMDEEVTEAMDKSERTYALVAACVEAGMSDAEAFACASVHEPTSVRHGGKLAAIRKDVARILPKVRAKIEPEPDTIPSPGAPFEVARLFFHSVYGDKRLARVGGAFWTYTGTHWREPEADELRAKMYHWLADKTYVTEKGKLAAWNPTRKKISDVEDALAALSQRRPETFGSGYCVSLENTILDIRTGETFEHTPDFFTTYALDFTYAKNLSKMPEWFRYLDSVFGDDHEARDCLQEIMGYILAGETSLQKIFLLVGVRRGGKGTIGRLLEALLGSPNVCSPTLSDLGSHFGAEVLVGKPLALLGESRDLGRGDKTTAKAVERLLTISGEDTQGIPRKNRTDWTGRLQTRFVLLANQIPSFRDGSGALSSRFVVLNFTRSFLGREDLDLDAKLYGERAAIFNWCLDGFERLMKRGRFVQPESGIARVRELEDMSAPVAAFVRDECEVSPDAVIVKDDLYAAWCEYMEDRGFTSAGNDVHFYRDLYGFYPQLTTFTPSSAAVDRSKRLRGIRLKSRE